MKAKDFRPADGGPTAAARRSPRREPRPFLNADGSVVRGSVSCRAYAQINGVRQGMFLRGRSDRNPVVLFLHGGPGMPEFFLAEKYMAALEDHFTFCYWEQRGAGLSGGADAWRDGVTAERLIDDVLAVTDFLRRRFEQPKIYLMAHSWGTFPGIQAAARAPERYLAYLGVAQVYRQQASEEQAYRYMLSRYRESGNRAMLRKLRNFEKYQARPALRDAAMHDLGIGTTHAMRSVFTGIFLPVMRCRAYTFPEKINLWRLKAKLRKQTDLRAQMNRADLYRLVPALAIPAYFFCGAYDLTVSRTLAEEYFRRMDAPVKGYYLFGQSAHSPIFEEPEKALRILLTDVTAGQNSLADIRPDVP